MASALDVGTGSGIQALHAAQHATRVTATDVNPRALEFTRLTLALSGAAPADLREGSLFDPVGTETYDLIVSNPPFVISPGARLTYRDGGMGGDDLCRTLVQQAGDRLNEGGYAQFLANWQHVEGEEWQDRVRSWVPAGCDAWIVQREVQDVTQYAELWLRDSGDHRTDPAVYTQRYEAWLDEFEARSTKAVGFGWITLRKSAEAAAGTPSIVAEEWPHAVEQPLGSAVEAHFARQDYLREHDDAALLAAHFTLAEEVVQEQVGLPGAEDPEHVVLRQHRGMRRATKVDAVGAGLRGRVRRVAARGPDSGRHRPVDGGGPGAVARPHPAGDPAAGGGRLPGPRAMTRAVSSASPGLRIPHVGGSPDAPKRSAPGRPGRAMRRTTPA